MPLPRISALDKLYTQAQWDMDKNVHCSIVVIAKL